MGDSSEARLHYGDLGRAVYQKDSGKWTWSRDFKESPSLISLGPPDICDEITLEPLSRKSTTCKDAREAAEAVNGLLKVRPIFGSASAGIEAYLRTPESASVSRRGHCSTEGDLLAVGRMFDDAGSIAPIAALPDGTRGNVLRILRIQTTCQTLATEPEIKLQVPAFAHAETQSWKADGKIEQVCFSESRDGSEPLLAVRSPNSVTLLRPSYLRAPLDLLQPKHSLLSRFSTIGPTLLQLPKPKSRGEAYMDVAFDPWNPAQLAAITGEGSWSVWKINGLQSIGESRISSIAQGKMKANPQIDVEESQSLRSNWHRILWLCDSQTVAMCSRRSLQISRINKTPLQLASPGFENGTTILDMRSSPSNRNHFFLLTTSDLVWLEAVPRGAGSEDMPISILASWKHSRNVEDLSLKLTTFERNEDANILLFSGLTPLITLFRMRKSEKLASNLIAVSDPVQLSLFDRHSKLFGDSLGKQDSLLDLHVMPVQTSPQNGNTTGVDCDENVKFFSVLLLTERSYFSGSLCFLTEVDSGIRASLQARQHTVRNGFATQIAVEASKGEMHGFVVDDEALLEDSESAMPLEHSFEDTKPEPSISREGLYYRLTQAAAEPEEFLPAIAATARTLNGLERLTLTPLQDLFPKQNTFLKFDVDAASEALSNIKKHFATADLKSGRTVLVHPLASPSNLSLRGVDQRHASLSQIYSHIIDHWLAPLPNDAPGQFRLTRERLARQVAAAVSLASLGVRIKDAGFEPEDSEAELVQPRSASQPAAGPSKRPRTKGSASSSTRMLAAEQSKRTRRVVADLGPTVQRLQRYIDVAAPTTPFPEALGRVLYHWQPGDDPSEYDYDETAASLAGAPATPGSDLTAEQQRRIERRRQRTAEREKRSQQVAASQPVLQVRAEASQPDTQDGSSQASQRQQQAAVASQIERGRYAQRPDGRKPKKGRKAGF